MASVSYFRNILVGVDGSAAGDRALEQGLALAAAFRGKIHVLSVEEHLPISAATVGEVDEERQYRDNYFAQLREKVRQAASRLNVAVQHDVVPGHAADELVRRARGRMRFDCGWQDRAFAITAPAHWLDSGSRLGAFPLSRSDRSLTGTYSIRLGRTHRRRISAEGHLRIYWYVAVGAAVGGVSRFALGGFIQQRAGADFPLGTLVINVTGSLLLGFIMRYALGSGAVSPDTRALLTTGFCGGYTTFSTFSYETAILFEEGEYRRAALYIALSVVVSLLGTLAGLAAASRLLARSETV